MSKRNILATDNDMSSYENRILVTTDNIQAVKAEMTAIDQIESLEVGCETWKFCYKGKLEQMTIWPNGKGAIQFGDESDWGRWDEERQSLYVPSDSRYANSSHIDLGGHFDKEGDMIFNCGCCGKLYKKTSKKDYPNYPSHFSCGRCGTSFCDECSDGLYVRHGFYGSVCVNCNPNIFVSSITIGTANPEKMLKTGITEEDNDFPSEEFNLHIHSQYTYMLQDKYFMYADINYSNDSDEIEIVLNKGIDDRLQDRLKEWNIRIVAANLRNYLRRWRINI